MSKPDDARHRSKEPERPGLVAVIGLALPTVAALTGLATVHSARRLSGGLLIGAGVVLFLVWILTDVSESPRFRGGIVTAFAVALSASGIYVIGFAPSSTRSAVNAPRLAFILNSPAKVPWCRTYQVSVAGAIPRGYRIVMFDSASDIQYNFSGPFSYDGWVSPVVREPGVFTSQVIFVGNRYAVKNGKPVSNQGFRAVVIAAVVPAQGAEELENVVAAPTGWGLKRLPGHLAEAVLDVERNHNVAHCLPPPPP